MHKSVPLLSQACEFINITQINPLISKCQIKVCYVGDSPNRNGSIITKQVATEIANTLPGSPIVGFYNKDTKDFEEHNRMIDISNGKFDIIDTTRPYGFVDLSAKVWFQKFIDDDSQEREYLVTEGWLWSGQYAEAQQIIDEGSNHSMELYDPTLKGEWTNQYNAGPSFFIINEATIEKLCILGKDVEPCFEGSQITSVQFSLTDEFKNSLFSMMKELKDFMNEGGKEPVLVTYAVEIGDNLWSALYSYLEDNYPDNAADYLRSIYSIEGIYEEAGSKFVILRDRDTSNKYFRLDFVLGEDGSITSDGQLTEVTKTYTPVATPQFALIDVESFETERYAKKNEEDSDKSEQEDTKESEESTEDKKKTYSLEEVTEYAELLNKYSQLEQSYNELQTQVASLSQFKDQVDLEKKQTMIDSFYMLSDNDKKDVIDNIKTYSLDDIESKLSVICVRNKVSFTLEDEETTTDPEQPIVYNLQNDGQGDAAPAWIKAVENVQKNLL